MIDQPIHSLGFQNEIYDQLELRKHIENCLLEIV
jgi:hypothetical protein